MAEALARSLDPTLEVSSAGLGATDGSPASEHAVTVAHRRGLDLSQHSSRALTEDLVEEADLILCMTDGHRQVLLRRFPSAAGKVFRLKSYASSLDEDVEDPYGGPLSAYDACLAELDGEIRKALTPRPL